VEGRLAERNRSLKVLETAKIKLASVVSDVLGALAYGCELCQKVRHTPMISAAASQHCRTLRAYLTG